MQKIQMNKTEKLLLMLYGPLSEGPNVFVHNVKLLSAYWSKFGQSAFPTPPPTHTGLSRNQALVTNVRSQLHKTQDHSL